MVSNQLGKHRTSAQYIVKQAITFAAWIILDGCFCFIVGNKTSKFNAIFIRNS